MQLIAIYSLFTYRHLTLGLSAVWTRSTIWEYFCASSLLRPV